MRFSTQGTMSSTNAQPLAGRLLIVATAFALAAAWLLSAAPAGALEGTAFAITEVNFGARTMQITNWGDAVIDPNGLTVCSFPDYAQISGAPTLAPGESATINLNDLGIPSDAADGELALYLNTRFDDPKAIVAYVEWGSSDHARSPVAQAGSVDGEPVWAGGSVDPAGASVITSNAAFPNAPSAWSAGSGAALPRTGIPGLGTALVGLGLLLAGAALLEMARRRTKTR